jgi:hypothetical protein
MQRIINSAASDDFKDNNHTRGRDLCARGDKRGRMPVAALGKECLREAAFGNSIPLEARSWPSSSADMMVLE